MPADHHPIAFERGVMVDVGPGVGALVVYAEAELQGHEVEISLRDDATERVHAVFLPRSTALGRRYAAVFGSLPEGRYHLWHETVTQPSDVLIVGGEVSEVDCR